MQSNCIKVFPATASPINHSPKPLNPESPKQADGNALKAVSLSELIKPLADALKQSQVWLEDFANEKVILSSDLYEVVTMFGKLQSKAESKTAPDPPDPLQQ